MPLSRRSSLPLLPRAVIAFRAAYPDTTLEIEFWRRELILSELDAMRVDIVSRRHRAHPLRVLLFGNPGRFKLRRQARRFLATHDQISIVFRPRRYQLFAISYRHARADAFDLWRGNVAEMAA